MSEKFNKGIYIALSLLIAVVFWLFVDSGEGNNFTEEFRGIPIEFIGETDTLPSRGLMMLENADTTIDLTLRGPRSVITSLRPQDLQVQVSLSGITAVGTHPLDYELLLPDNINRNDVTIERASRSRVTVKVTELFSKTVPVRAEVVGELPDGYMYKSELLAVEPSTITVSGLEADVAPVDSAHLVVSLEGANATIRKEFGYELLDAEGNPIENDKIRVSDKQVEVTAPIYMLKTLALTVKLIESPGSLLEYVDVKQDFTSIEVAGEAASLANKEDILLAEINLSDYQGDQEIVLDIKLPAGCENISGITSTKLTIDFKDNVETRVFNVTDISPIGVEDGKVFSRLTNSVDVLVRGPAEELDLLTEESIRIVVDMANFVDNGTYSVPAKVLVDGGSGMVGAVGGPYSVSCKITS